MAKIELPNEMILPTPINDREIEIFKALQDAYRNISLTLQNLQDSNTLQFVQTASGNINNSTTETTLVSTGNGTATLEANFLNTGRKIRVKASGFYSNTGTPTLRLKVKFGSVVILDTTAFTTSSGAANNQWDLEGIITVRTSGATGTVIGQGTVSFNTSGTAAQIVQMVNTATIVVDTTVSTAVTVTAQWGTASSSNTITCTDLTLENMN